MTFKQLLASISKQEWRWVLITALVLIVLTTAPYIYAYFNAPDGSYYSGGHALAPEDSYIYFSYINQIKEGNWLLHDYYTSEIQTVGLFNLFWIAVGLLAKIFGLSALLAFHLARSLLLPIFLAVLYIFIAYFFDERNKRFLVFLFACFSSGIGSYFAIRFHQVFIDSLDSLIYRWPFDLWVPESNIFLTLYHSPLLEASWIMMMLSLLFFILALKNNKYYYSAISGFFALVWFNFHPYYFPYFLAITLIYALIIALKDKIIPPIIHFLIVLSLSLPSFFYHYYMIQSDYVIGARASQNITLSSPFIFIFLGFGFLLIGAVIGLYYQYRNKQIFNNEKIIFLAVWLVCGFILIYSPIVFQRRFIEGLQLPLVFFTVLAIWEIRDYIKLKLPGFFQFLKGNYVFLCFMFIIFFGFSTLFNLVRDDYYFNSHYFRFYNSNDYIAATTWLKANNPDKSVVMSYQTSGLILPSLINNPVFIGHDNETINYKDKKMIMVDFWDDKYTDTEVLDLFKANNIKYVLYTNYERDNFVYKPQTKNYLEPVWQGSEMGIYKVK